MTVTLLVLTVLATIRGWFPWAPVLFGLFYGATLVGSGTLGFSSAASSAAIALSDGSMAQYGLAAALSGMVVFGRA